MKSLAIGTTEDRVCSVSRVNLRSIFLLQLTSNYLILDIYVIELNDRFNVQDRRGIIWTFMCYPKTFEWFVWGFIFFKD